MAHIYFFFFGQKGMLFFDTAQFDGILKKITEFNNTLITQVSYWIKKF